MHTRRAHHLLEAVLQQLSTSHVRIPAPGALAVPDNVVQPRVYVRLLCEQPGGAGVDGLRAAEAQNPLHQAVALLHEQQGRAMLLDQVLPSACTSSCEGSEQAVFGAGRMTEVHGNMYVLKQRAQRLIDCSSMPWP